MTHAEATKMVRGISYRTRRKIGNNTFAEILHDGSVAIRLHSTIVVTIRSDNSVVLNSGGYQTRTTKDRINKYSHAGLYQKNFIWYLRDGSRYYDGYVLLQI